MPFFDKLLVLCRRCVMRPVARGNKRGVCAKCQKAEWCRVCGKHEEGKKANALCRQCAALMPRERHGRQRIHSQTGTLPRPDIEDWIEWYSIKVHNGEPCDPPIFCG